MKIEIEVPDQETADLLMKLAERLCGQRGPIQSGSFNFGPNTLPSPETRRINHD